MKKEKMKQEMNCPICHEKIYSELGKECRMCGMVLEDESRDFCSRICRKNYKEINPELKNNENQNI